MRQASGGSTPNAEATVYVVHQDATTRSWLKDLLCAGWIKVACFDSVEAILDVRHPTYPSCAVVNLRLPGLSGLELQRLLHQRFACLPILLLTEQADVSSAVAAMKQGAYDFIEHPVREEYLVQQVHSALSYGHALHQQEIEFKTLIARLDVLSEREHQVLEGLVRGGTNRSIAGELGVSPKTVEMHRSSLHRKMHAESLAELVRMYYTAKGHKARVRSRTVYGRTVAGPAQLSLSLGAS